MERTITADIEAAVDDVTTALADLTSYPEWVEVVHRVDPAEAADGDGGPAWWVTLRAQVGPLARNKRLRIVRRDDRHLTFLRREIDDREHAHWEMEADAKPNGDGSVVEIRLTYGGRLWSSALDGLLDRAAERATHQLEAHLNRSH